jgi:hypothetical protein
LHFAEYRFQVCRINEGSCSVSKDLAAKIVREIVAGKNPLPTAINQQALRLAVGSSAGGRWPPLVRDAFCVDAASVRLLI